MKYKFLVATFVVILISNLSKSQNYNELANQSGKQIAEKFQLKQTEIKEIVGGKQDLKILVLPFTNTNNEFTPISQNLTSLITNVIQNNIKGSFSAFNTIKIDYSEKEKASYDLFLTANYSISNNSFIINNLFFIKPDKSQQIAIDHISISLQNPIELQIQDYALIAKDIDQLSRSLVIQFKKNEGLTKVKLTNFVENQTSLASQFSELLATALERDFPAFANISVQRNQTRALNSTITYTIDGKYFIENDLIRVNCYLTDPNNKMTLASASASIEKQYFNNNSINYLPENTSQFQQNISQAYTNTPQKDFQIDLWTNKGNQNPIFVEGDKLSIFVQTDRPCYIRVIDIFADGTKVLLIDNFFIDASRTNQPYKLPQEFLCSEPFGAEMICIYAQTIEPFSTLPTIDYYGYKKIQQFTRVFSNKQGNFSAEKCIKLVTVARKK